MNILRTALLAMAMTASLAACQQHTASTPAGSTTTSTSGIGDGTGDGVGDGIGDTIDRAMNEGRTKLATENIKLSEGTRHAEISPKGDLIIDGRDVPVNPQQRQLLLEYRGEVLGVASAGMDVGAEGAKLASKAVTEAIAGIFSGQPDRVGQRVEAQAAGIRERARTLCSLLPPMYATQRKLAAALPEFAPFATMKPDEAGKCHDNIEKDAPSAATPPPAAPSPPAPTSGAT